MTRARLIGALGGLVAALVLAYFALLAAKPRPLARILLRRGYEDRGWTEQRLAARIRVLGVAGVLVALAAILLAVAKFVG